MFKELNKNYLITTTSWFVAPDGRQYRAVFGKVTGVHSDAETLGIKTNRHSTNWYVTVGNMIVAGCQIHYVIKTDEVSTVPPTRDIAHEGTLNVKIQEGVSQIYNAND